MDTDCSQTPRRTRRGRSRARRSARGPGRHARKGGTLLGAAILSLRAAAAAGAGRLAGWGKELGLRAARVRAAARRWSPRLSAAMGLVIVLICVHLIRQGLLVPTPVSR
ncbi:MAG TPA: hypothetical protein DGR79_03835, partial [Clostridiales bacterium]|nr:hypothetical protein [Clostridiales bacterium]